MRELNECTAEVFRRSEKRIKARKKNRNRILAACIPVCLIAAIWPVMDLPARIPEMEAAGRAPLTGEAAGNAPESFACLYTAVEIQETGVFPEEHYGKVTDTAAVAEVFQTVQSLFADAFSDVQNVISAGENNINGDLVQSPDQPKVYTITFTAEDGSQTVYQLSGNTLVDVSANETVFLSGTQAAGLLAVFGLTE